MACASSSASASPLLGSSRHAAAANSAGTRAHKPSGLGAAGAAFGLADDSVVTNGGGIMFGLTVGVSLCGAMIIATVVGSLVPMIFQRLSIDPAVATGPFVTTAVDILGVLFYFLMAATLLGL